MNTPFVLFTAATFGITVLDEFSPATDEVVENLRGLGFDVDVYGLVSSSVVTTS